MKRLSLDQSGFGHLAIILVIVVIAGVGLAGWYVMSQNSDTKNSGSQNNQNSSQNPAQAESADEKDIELQNLGVASITDAIAIDTNATRDFNSRGLKGYYNFGNKLSGNRLNPNFEFASVKPGTPIIAAIDGFIGFTRQQADTNDYEVFLQPKEGSKWTIGYDHLVNITVKQGDKVKAGDKLGEAAKQNNGLLRFEFQVNKDENRKTTHLCPTPLLSSAAKDKVISELTSMQNAWEQKTGLELYDVSAQNPVGCLLPSMSPEQAQGQN